MPRKQNGLGNFKSFSGRKSNMSFNKPEAVKSPGTYNYPLTFGTRITRTPVEKYNIDSLYAKWRKGYEYYSRNQYTDFDEYDGLATVFAGLKSELRFNLKVFRFASRKAKEDTAVHYTTKREQSENQDYTVATINEVLDNPLENLEAKNRNELWCSLDGYAGLLHLLVGEEVQSNVGSSEVIAATPRMLFDKQRRPNVFTGVKDVREHTGTEMLLVRPKRGGDTHQVKEWWRNGGVSTCYCDCTIFDVTAGGDTVKLVLDTSIDTDIRIDHDGSFNFSFYGVNEIKRAALYTADFELIEHYEFPSVSKGKIVPRSFPGSASRPGGGGVPPAVPTIGTVTLTGNAAVNDGDTEAYTVSISGDASPSYVLTSSDAGDTVSGLDVTYSGAGARTLTVTAIDVTASDNPATGTLLVNAAVLFSTRVSNADFSYAVTVADTGNGNKYQIDGIEQDSISATAGQTIHFDLSDASLSGHPFKIYTDSNKTTEVTVGVEQEGTDFIFTPPIAGTFSYQCQAHAAMGGDIIVTE